MLLITVQPQLSGTRVALRFPYNEALIECLKEMPGVQWNAQHKFWTCPKSAFSTVAEHVEKYFVGVQWRFTGQLYPDGLKPLSPAMVTTQRPYQVDAGQRLLSVPGYLLSFEPRVGKTVATAAAIGSALMQGLTDVAVIIYPNGVSDEWKNQLPKFTGGRDEDGGWYPQNGLKPFMLESHTPLTPTEITQLQNTRYLVIGCHMEILTKRLKCIKAALNGRRYSLTWDEIHKLRNRKSALAVSAFDLAHQPNCVYRWALTGTPMRNRPRDIWPTFQFLEKDSMGGYWTYAKRYAGAFQDERGHWQDKGTAKENQAELFQRLAAVSYRLTRADVAPWLPKAENKMILCTMDQKTQAFYAAHERAVAPALQQALSDNTNVAAANVKTLRHLSDLVADVKIPMLVDRVKFHSGEREVKTLVFANYHEPLEKAQLALESEFHQPGLQRDAAEVPVYCAGGWMTPAKRKEEIEKWKNDPRPGVLLANTISSGVGIDLSAAQVTIFLELSWVPADFVQAQARTENIHLADTRDGAPPLYEYLLVKNTVDQDMAVGMINKFTAIEQVVGADRTSVQANEMLRTSGLVDRGVLGLRNEDPETVRAALKTLRARLLGIKDASAAVTDSNIALAVDVAEAMADEAEETPTEDSP